MRISPMRQVCAAVAAAVSIIAAGCANPSSQTLVSLAVTATPNSLSVGGAAVLKATAHLSDGTTQDVSSGTLWTVSDNTLASVSNGTMTAKAAGTVTLQAAYVEATPAGSSPASTAATPTPITASAQVTISAAGTTNVPTLTWTAPAAIAYGTVLSATQLDATANVPGTFAYTPAAGVLLAAGTQSLSVTFTPTDIKTYSAATATVQMLVNPAPLQTKPNITWAAPATIVYGTALSSLQLDATASVAGTFAYTPAAGTVLPSGTQTLSVMFTPTDSNSYTTAVASVQVVVNPAASGQTTPVITWAKPASIIYGSALSGAQLNAIASVAGTFAYTPAAGTVLPAGNQTLSVMFTPADSKSYTTAVASVQLVVNPAASGQTTPGITWAKPASIIYGSALSGAQLNATANTAGTFVYTPAAGALLKAGTQTLSVIFTPTDTATYGSATASVQLVVNQAAPAITWATPASINVGTALSAAQLDATASVPGSFVYTPAAGIVLAAGTQTLTTVFTATDAIDFASATANTTLTVKGAPTSSPVLPIPSGCGGPTINLNSGMSQSTLQSSITNAPTCSLIVFAAGTYSLSSHIEIPCKNLQIAGPVLATPSAILSASFSNDDIFDYDGTCANMGSVQYLQFANAGGVYVRSGNNSNFLFQYNLVTGLPAQTSSGGGIYATNESGVFFDGGISNTTSNITIVHNTFGDNNSCAATFPLATDEGGSCAGVLTHTGTVNNLTINYNKFLHVEEGIHIEQLISFSVGAQSSTCVSCTMDYNYIANYHRIGIEVQVSTPTNSIMMEHNAIVDPVNSSWGTFAISMACCQYANTFGVAGFGPGYIANDNVLVSTLPIGSSGWGPPMGIEFWGNGSIAENNLIQGTFLNGVSYGYGGGTWQVNNNYICGAKMSSSNSFVSNEEGEKTPPSQSGNKSGATCSATPSQAPTISPAGGSFIGSQSVTLTDAGANTGIWYTTDGSTPLPGSGTSTYYTGPFTVSSNATVKAVGMWGTIDQPTSYTSGYGYVPSGVVSASFVSGSVVKSPTAQRVAASVATWTAVSPIAVTISPASPQVAIGASTQVKATAIYGDGSVKDVTGNFAWSSADSRTARVSAAGVLSGLASGKVVVSGTFGGMRGAVTAVSGVGGVEWSAPITITRGGTYSGNWQSTDGKTAAVTIATTAPVVIENAYLRSAGRLIEVQRKGADVTVRNSLGIAVEASGVFLEIESPAHLDVENNYLENVRDGVIVHGYSGNQTQKGMLVVRANRARNLNGLAGTGSGGASRFVELEGVQSAPGVELGWNEVINYPSQSRVSDVIRIYRSSGTANHPLEVHDSYVQGAYPDHPARDTFSGGGIKIDGALDDDAEHATAFTSVHDNQVVSTGGYGISFSAGHDNSATENRLVSSGMLSDGSRIAAQRTGLIEVDALGNRERGAMYNNTMHDNLVAWVCGSCSQEEDLAINNQWVPGNAVTPQTEDAEYELWLSKLAAAGITVGPSF